MQCIPPNTKLYNAKSMGSDSFDCVQNPICVCHPYLHTQYATLLFAFRRKLFLAIFKTLYLLQFFYGVQYVCAGAGNLGADALLAGAVGL